MSQTAKSLLILYDKEASKWATHLQSLFQGPVPEAGICCCDITEASRQTDDSLSLAQYACKLLILSRGMLRGLCPRRCFFLGRVLTPAARVVVVLCGVDSLAPLLDLVPLNADEWLQISTEQDVSSYLSAVTDIMKKGVSASNVNAMTQEPSRSEQKAQQTEPTGADGVASSIVVIPPRIHCGSSTEVFILLKNEAAAYNIQVEFIGGKQKLRVKPVRWNDRTLCVRAPDFPAGSVSVDVYSGGARLHHTQLQYYTSMEEIGRLLSRAADPVDFMCQALQVSSVEKLDQKLSTMLLEGMPAGGFQELQRENTPEKELRHADVPSLLHFAAVHGLTGVAGLLLQCPGAKRAAQTANRRGQTPAEVAKSRGHRGVHVLLKETLNVFDNADASVYEMMCDTGALPITDTPQEEDEEGEDEDPYLPLGASDEYDTILASAKTAVIANRPPAPTPRPDGARAREDRTPYITQVFQNKKTTQVNDLYSLPTKRASEWKHSLASTYDTFAPDQLRGPQQLVGPQQRVNAPEVQRGGEAKLQEKLNHPQAGNINRKDDHGVSDKIDVVHHAPSVAGKESRRGSLPVESHFNRKPLKGQQRSHFFQRADKK